MAGPTKADLLAENEQMRADFVMFVNALHDRAESEDLCPAYDRLIVDLNERMNVFTIPGRERDVEIEAKVRLTFDFCLFAEQHVEGGEEPYEQEIERQVQDWLVSAAPHIAARFRTEFDNDHGTVSGATTESALSVELLSWEEM